MGKVHEQGQRWSDAAANYEMAWQLTNRQQPAIGNILSTNRQFPEKNMTQAPKQIRPL